MENTTENNERIVRKANKSKRICILARSDIAGSMVPTDWGFFTTIGDAEIFARKHIKSTVWAVGEEVTKKDAFGKVLEVTHEIVTPTFNPRRYDEE